jgi:hypothetical protein
MEFIWNVLILAFAIFLIAELLPFVYLKNLWTAIWVFG